MPIAIGNISNLPTANISNVLATQVHISTDYMTKQTKGDRHGRFLYLFDIEGFGYLLVAEAEQFLNLNINRSCLVV